MSSGPFELTKDQANLLLALKTGDIVVKGVVDQVLAAVATCATDSAEARP
jgi:hypothetical protein